MRTAVAETSRAAFHSLSVKDYLQPKEREVMAVFDRTPADRRETFADLNIWARVEWSRTTRGGRQFDLLAGSTEPTACASAYGLRE